MGDDGTPRRVLKLIRGNTADDAKAPVDTPSSSAVPAMYRIAPSAGGLDSWTCNGSHVLVLRWNHPPSAVTFTSNNESSGTISRPWSYNVFEQRGTRVVLSAQCFESKEEAVRAHAVATDNFQPLEVELSVDEFLACSDSVRSSAVMFQPGAPVHFDAPKTPLQLHLECSLGRPISPELLVETAWILGAYMELGVGDKIAVPCDERATAFKDRFRRWRDCNMVRIGNQALPLGQEAGTSIPATPFHDDLVINTCEPVSLLENNWCDARSAIVSTEQPVTPLGVNSHSKGDEVMAAGELLSLLVKRLDLGNEEAAIPRALLSDSLPVRQAFAAGILDTRGHISVKDQVVHLDHLSEEHLKTVRHLLRGVGCEVGAVLPVQATCTYAMHVHLGAHLSALPTHLPGRSIPLPQENASQPLAAFCSSFTVTKVAHAAYYGLQLDGNRRCLLDDFTVTHNSKEVKIYRLVTRGTYESDMFKRASMKLGLDQAVLKKSGLDVASGVDGNQESNALSTLNKQEIESLLRNGAYALLDDPEAEKASTSFCEADIDSILANRTTVIKSGGNDADSAPREASTFSRAVFASEDADARLDINDKLFWEKLLPDERSANKLMEKLISGEAYATLVSRAEFMHHLAGHVKEIISEYQQGNSLDHVPVITDILRTIANTPLPDANAPIASPNDATPMEIDGNEEQKSNDAGSVDASGKPKASWSRDQIRQAMEWLTEIEKVRTNNSRFGNEQNALAYMMSFG